MKKVIKKLALIIPVLFAVIITSCGEDESADVYNTPIKVKTEKIVKTEVPFQFEFPGTVEGIKKVKLSTKLMGEIVYFPFEAGAKVKKNQVLAKIRSADLEAKRQQVKANILQAEAAFQNIEINYKRVKSLYEKESATKKELEDITLAYDMAKARLKAAQEMEKEIIDVLSYSKITAPFNGYIVNKFFEEGDIAAPGHPLMIVEDFSNFKIISQVPSSEINLFEKDENIKVSIDAVPGHSFEGKVIEINPGGNSFSKQFQVQALIDNNNDKLSLVKSGMYAKLILENKTKPIIAIDESILVNRGQLKGVYSITQNNEALLRWLRLGKNVNGKKEVLSGLSEGDVIIVDKDKVKDGQKVEVL